jgi:hypothetical protein
MSKTHEMQPTGPPGEGLSKTRAPAGGSNRFGDEFQGCYPTGSQALITAANGG